MPRFDNSQGETLQRFDTGHYGYSGAGTDQLEEVATTFTVVTIVVDESPSIREFAADMEECLIEIVQAGKDSPHADNLLLRMVAFSSGVREVHGFRLLDDCKADDYRGCLQPHGLTALSDAADNAIGALGDYTERLKRQDFEVNAIVFIVTDGLDNNSDKATADTIRKTLEGITQREAAESLITCLVGVNGNAVVGPGGVLPEKYHDGWTVNQYLERFKEEAGLTHFIPLPDASTQTLAKVARFVSKSVSAQSQSRGTGAPASISPSI